MRIVALLAAYNESRFIAACLDHLLRNGIEAYLCDNESTDETVEIARRYLGRGLIGIETIPRPGCVRWGDILQRKEQLAMSLDADWFIHMDPDEFRLPPRANTTLAKALAEADAQGFNAVHFFEYVFIPTREEPDHDHPRFMETMRRYYPFRPFPRHRTTAWKKQADRVELAWSGGHKVRFPDLRVCPQDFRMRHYLYLSREHAAEKYLTKKYPAEEIEKGWHGWRANLKPNQITLPGQSELRIYTGDDQLDPSHPLTKHLIDPT